MIKETYNKVKAIIKGVSDDTTKDLLLNLQKSLEYCMEENSVLREVLRDDFHCKKVKLSSQQKKRLSQKAISLDKHVLEDVAGIFKPETILGWHRDLVGQKYDSSKSSPKNKRGPKPVPQEYVDAILKFAKRNPSWGYKRIASTMVYLGMKVSASTVKRVLDDYGIVPDPEQKKRIDWERFISSHMDSLAATDFFTVEVMTPVALVRYMVLFFIDIKTRKVELAGIANDPDGKWMAQMARNQTDAFDGFLLGKKYLIHDRDPLYTKQFDAIMEGSGIKIKRLPAFMPVMNSFAESFVKSIKTECINKMIVTSEKQLRYIVKEYIEHYNHERPHRGLGGKMIEPYPQDEKGEIVEFNRLGGLLRSYRRVSTLQAAA